MMLLRVLLSLILSALLFSPALAADPTDGATGDARAMSPDLPPILSLREQAEIQDAWLGERLDTLVPELMRQNGVDMWILVAREYLEDPVMATMFNATTMRARRRTILVFYDRGEVDGVERLTVSRYGMGGFFDPAWNPEDGLDQWETLANLIKAREPKTIALNISPRSAFADGLTQSQYTDMLAAWPQAYQDRIVPPDALAIGWLETRIPAEVEWYQRIVQTAHAIIGEGLSGDVITPGLTTAEDMSWWFRERVRALGLDIWFHTSFALQREGAEGFLDGDTVIQNGDLLWMDLGIVYLGLSTDTQHMAYVLKDGETDVPDGLKAGLRAASRVQDHLTGSYEVGLSGNDVLARARTKALADGLEPSIYTHALGFHGHGAGPSIGFWDNQNADPRGDGPVNANTAWAIESNATFAVPEWGDQRVVFRTEEDGFFDGETVHYINGRQTEFHLIRPPNTP